MSYDMEKVSAQAMEFDLQAARSTGRVVLGSVRPDITYRLIFDETGEVGAFCHQGILPPPEVTAIYGLSLAGVKRGRFYNRNPLQVTPIDICSGDKVLLRSSGQNHMLVTGKINLL